jgi:bifunctional non-homologous end joining protein LigD
MPDGLLLDGELVAFSRAGVPHWPLVCDRILHGDTSIPVRFVAFDVLRIDGHDLTCNPWSSRRALLDELELPAHRCLVSEVFDDGQALYQAVVDHGLEGIVAKRRRGLYRPGFRGWIKIKNPGYWRRESEVEGFRRSLARV